MNPTPPPRGKYKWNMKAIAIPCSREFIYRDETQARLIPKNAMMVFYENSQLDIFSPEQFQLIFRAELTSDPNILMYVKTVDITVEEMKEPFSVTRGPSFILNGNPGDYLITETSFPFNKYIFTKSEYQKYIKFIIFDSGNSDDDEGERKVEDEGRGEEEVKDGGPIDSNSCCHMQEEPRFESIHKFVPPSINDGPIITRAKDSSLPQEITQFAKFVNYNSEQHVFTYNWNLKNYSYLAIKITEQQLSIEFLNHTIRSHSKRYSGERGDYLICNTGGKIFAIVTPEEFELLFETGNSFSNIFFIRHIRVKNIVGVPLNNLTAAYWCGTIEFGQKGDVLMQFELPGAQRDPHPQPEPQLRNIYQLIISSEELIDQFQIKDDSDDRISEAQAEGEQADWKDEIIIREKPFIDPFENYNLKIPCWKGTIKRFVRGKRSPHWKDTPVEVYGDYLILKPDTQYPRQLMFIQSDSIRDVTDAERDYIGNAFAVCGWREPPVNPSTVTNMFGQLIGRVDVLVKTNEYFTVDSDAVNPTTNETIISTQQYFSHSLLTLAELKELFQSCRAWTKRQQLWDLIFQVSQKPQNMNKDAFGLMLTKTANEFTNEFPQILTCPMNNKPGRETLVHKAIKYLTKDYLNKIFSPFEELIVVTEFHRNLSKRSFCCRVSDYSQFTAIKTPDYMFTSIEEEEGNTLLMLLCERGSYRVVSEIIKKKNPSEEYLNTQNYKQQTLLALALNLLLATNLIQSEIPAFLSSLLQNKCNPNLQDAEGNTCLHTLCFMFNSRSSGNESLATKLLIAQVIEDFVIFGSDITVRNNRNETPLSIYCQMKDDLEHISFEQKSKSLLDIADLLTGNNGDLLNPSTGANCPLHICADRGLSKLFSHFIQRGAVINLKNSDGERPLDLLNRKLEPLRKKVLLSPDERNISDRLKACEKVVMNQNVNPENQHDPHEEVENSNGIIFHSVNGRNEIISGEVFALIRYLCWSTSFNECDSHALVSGYPYLCNDHEVFLDQIISLYDQRVRSLNAGDERINSSGLFGLLYTWAKVHQIEIEPLLSQDKVTVFVNQLIAHSGHLLNQQIIQDLSSNESQKRLTALFSLNNIFQFHRSVKLNSRIEGLVIENKSKLTSLFQTAKSPLTEPGYFSTRKPEELVQQFSLAMKYILDKITREEFISSKFRELEKYKETIKSYFITEILRYPGMEDRVNTIAQLLRCVMYADTLYSNYELIDVINASLTSPPVFRLTDTLRLVQEKYSNEWNHVQKLTIGGCKLLRDRMASCPPSPPAVPYVDHYVKAIQNCTLAPHVIDIEGAGEGIGHANEAGIASIKHLNFESFKTQSKLFLEFQKYQSIPYLYQYNEEIQVKVVNCGSHLYHGAALDERSTQLQPMI